MTLLQHLSRQEQMEAHRRDFADFWNQFVRGGAMKNDPVEVWVIKQLHVWNKWLKENTP